MCVFFFYERKINKVRRHGDAHGAAADNLLKTVLCLIKALFNLITGIVGCVIAPDYSVSPSQRHRFFWSPPPFAVLALTPLLGAE